MVVGRATQSSKPTTWRTAASALRDAVTQLPGNPKTAPSVVRPRVCVSTFCPAGRFPAVLTNTHMNSTQNLKKRPGCRCDNRKWPSPSWPVAGGSAGAARPVGENGPQSRRLGTCWRPRAARWAPRSSHWSPKGELDDGCVVQGASWATRGDRPRMRRRIEGRGQC